MAGLDAGSYCKWADDHPVIEERLGQLEKRADKHDDSIDVTNKAVTRVDRQLLSLETQVKTAVAVGVTVGSGLGVTLGLLLRAFK